MTASPLQFARAFAALKSALATQPVGDRRLLTLAEFWPNLADHRGNASYQSYVDEFAALFADSLSADGIADCSPEELVKIRRVARDVAAPGQWEAIDHALARAWAYAGEIERAVRVCAEATGEVEALSGLAEEGGAGETPLSERERLIETASRLREKAPLTAARLEQIAAEWEDELGHLWFDRVRCLLVETNGDETARGRMRTLVGAVEPIGKRLHRPSGAESDEVTFEGQLRTPDDPFIGVVYDSLKSVRPLLRRPGMLPKTARRKDGEESFHAHYRVEGNSGAVTGDSIGLAAALIAYTQLLRPEVTRWERFVSSEVVFTGGIDGEGRLLPVNAVTLGAKVERAFFSPVRYVVVPSANEAEARATIAKLSGRYPHRKLRLIAAERLADVVENRNIVRSERVCMGEFVAKKAVRWGRGMRVQAALLAVLIYVLLAITWTKTFAPWWFDWNVAAVRFQGSKLIAANAGNQVIWVKKFGEDPLDSHHTKWVLGQLDGDVENELALIPSVSAKYMAGQSLYLFDSDGTELRAESPIINGQFPMLEMAGRQWYPEFVDLIGSGSDPKLVTGVATELPAQLHLKVFDRRRGEIGWYVHQGYGTHHLIWKDPPGQPLFVFTAPNNVMERVAVCMLDARSVRGVSPPYTITIGELPRLEEGTQVAYILLPRSLVADALSMPYGGSVVALQVGQQSMLIVKTREGPESQEFAGIRYEINRDMRVVDVIIGEGYKLLRRNLVMEGRIAANDTVSENQQLLQAVNYWRGTEWISEEELQGASGK